MNQERIYTVLREPHISEKVSVLGDLANQYAFKVAPDATRAEVREAVEAIFKASVTKVTTANVCLLYTSPSPRDGLLSRMPSSA